MLKEIRIIPDGIYEEEIFDGTKLNKNISTILNSESEKKRIYSD